MNNQLSSIFASSTIQIGLSALCCNKTIGFVIYLSIADAKAFGSTTSHHLSLSFVEAYQLISTAQSSSSLTDFVSRSD
jgi:hypothetical protein